MEWELTRDEELGVHVWRSLDSGSVFLGEERFGYRAGVSHAEDLPLKSETSSCSRLISKGWPPVGMWCAKTR